MAKYLNESGLTVLWGNIKNYFPSVKHAVNGTATLNTDIAAGNLATFAIDDNNNVSLQGIALTALPVNSHAHGNITNAGAITATGVNIASGDALVITDSSASGKLVKSDITFDGSTTSQFLTKKGDWGAALTSHQSLGLIVGNSATAATEASSTANTTTFLNLLGGGAFKDSVQVTGTNNISVTGAAGKITISGLENTVTGSGLTANTIVLGNGNSGIKTSGKTITETLGSDNTTVPTSKAVATAISNATSGLSGAMHFVGSTTTALSDGATTTTLEGSSLTKTTGFVSGDVVLSGSKEFVWTGSAWELLGDEGSYALKTVTITGSGVLGGGGAISSNQTITHNTSALGITENTSYGPTANVTGSNNATIKVPQITVDKYGHITAVTERTFTAQNNTYTVGSKLLKLSDGTNTKTAIGVNENSSDRTVTFSGDGWITPTVGGSDNAATVSFAHAACFTGTAGSFGPTANVTGNEGNTIKVPQITVDADGHVTAITERTYTSKNTTYTVNNATLSLQGSASSATATSTGFSANGSTNTTLKFAVSGSAVTGVTTAAASNGVATITIASASSLKNPNSFTVGTKASSTGTATNVVTYDGSASGKAIYFSTAAKSTTNVQFAVDANGFVTGTVNDSGNTASLNVSDAANRKISTTETSSKYIQFNGGTNQFTVTDGTSSFNVSVANGMEEISDAEINAICVL